MQTKPKLSEVIAYHGNTTTFKSFLICNQAEEMIISLNVSKINSKDKYDHAQ